MKMTLKRIIPVLSLMLALMMLASAAGCSSIAPVKGKYKVLSIDAEGPEQYFTADREGGITLPDDYDGALDEFIMLTLNDDGSAEITRFGKTETGSWSESDNRVTIELSGGETIMLARQRATATLGYVFKGAHVILTRAK